MGARLGPPCRQARGFTLLEVLVALAIIATALVALLALENRSVTMIDSADRLEDARLVAERLMGEAELTGVPGGERKGTDGAYEWVLTETRMSRETVPPGVPVLPGRQLSLRISWMEGKHAETLTLATYVYAR